MNKVSVYEVIAFAMTVVIATAVMFTPYFAVQAAGQSAWISAFVAGLIACLPTAAAAYAISKYPGKSVIQALPEMLGTFLGKAVAIVFACTFLFFAALGVWRMEAFAIRFLIPETPQLAIRIVFLLAVSFGALSGSIPLLRTNAYVVPLAFSASIVTLILTADRINFSYLFPVFEGGVMPTLKGAILLLGWYCQVPLVILMFQRHIEEKSLPGTGLKSVLGVIALAVSMTTGFAGVLAAFGPRQTETMYYPALSWVRITSISTFLEHTEVAFVLVWMASIYLATTFYIQCFAESISDTLNLRGKAAKVWLIFFTILLLAVWPLFRTLSIYSLIYTIRDYGSPAGIIVGGILPLILFLRVLLFPPKKNKGKKATQKSSSGQEK